MPQIRNLILITLALLLLACSPPPDNLPSSMSMQGGYRCIAVNRNLSSQRIQGWSENKRKARAYALNNCNIRSRQHAACRIVSCKWYGARRPHHTSRKKWHTCYINNRQNKGVWSGTSHRRFDAVSRAFSRCRHKSGHPASCYFSYCKVW